MAAPVKHTCPDIDKAIKTLKEVQRTASVGMKSVEKSSDQWDMFRDIEWEIDGLIGTLEDLRKSNEELRAWGEDLDKEVENSANYIGQLEDKVNEIKTAQD